MIDREFVKENIRKIFDMVDDLYDEKRYDILQELLKFEVELLSKIEKPIKTHHGGLWL